MHDQDARTCQMKTVRFYMERTSLLLFTASEKELWIKSYNLLKISVSEDFHSGQKLKEEKIMAQIK